MIVNGEEPRGTRVVVPINPEATSGSDIMATASATEMVITRSRSNEVRRQKEEYERSPKRDQVISNSREVIMEMPEPYQCGFLQTYTGITYGTPMSFDMVLPEGFRDIASNHCF